MGYFGDYDDKAKELEEKKRNEENYRVKPTDKKTDDEGKIVLH